MEDLMIFEVVDRNNRLVPPGVYGDRLLITVLGSRTQPLIRYELDDSVRLAIDRCPCDRPFALIDDIQGRVEDVLSFPGVTGGMVDVHPLVFSRIMDTLPVSGWQVIQEIDGLHVLVSGMCSEVGDERLANTLQQALISQGTIVPHVEVQRVDTIPMSTYYTGGQARRYNARWRTFSEKTLAETLAMIDVTALRSVPERLGRLPRLLDVACGMYVTQAVDRSSTRRRSIWCGHE